MSAHCLSLYPWFCTGNGMVHLRYHTVLIELLASGSWNLKLTQGHERGPLSATPFWLCPAIPHSCILGFLLPLSPHELQFYFLALRTLSPLKTWEEVVAAVSSVGQWQSPHGDMWHRNHFRMVAQHSGSRRKHSSSELEPASYAFTGSKLHFPAACLGLVD